MATPAPMISLSSASPDVEDSDGSNITQHVLHTTFCKAIDSPLVKQTPPKSPANHAVPEKQQAILHEFLFHIDQGTFGILCGDKVCHPFPGMDHESWSLEKSTVLPRTLAQLACHDFKKEPPDRNTAVLSPQYSYASHIL